MLSLKKINKNCTIGILDLKIFSLNKINITRREIEKAGAKWTLEHLLNFNEFELLYTPENKPYLNNRTEHISISHSYDKLAIIINKKAICGIDIELIRNNVLKIKHKYLNEYELKFANNDVEKLITYWSGKETLFKLYGLKNIDFIKNLFVEDFSAHTFYGRIEIGEKKTRYLLKREKIENYILVYSIDEV